MRLTLRTLLAYLDDRLSPVNARDIGLKISKSEFTTELVERIRDVKRRRRLVSLDKPVPTIDSNLVAEYLDDQLTPELVARIEREVLSHDVCLAEVAATHEILGMLRDPNPLNERLRGRLHAVDPTGRIQAVQTLTGGAPRAEAAGSAAIQQPPGWKPIENRTPLSRRVPIILLVTMVFVWVALVVTDPNLTGWNQTGPQNRAANGSAAMDTPGVDSLPDDDIVAMNTDADDVVAADRGATAAAAPAAIVAAESVSPTGVDGTVGSAPQSGTLQSNPVSGSQDSAAAANDDAAASHANGQNDGPAGNPAPGNDVAAMTSVAEPPAPVGPRYRLLLRDDFKMAMQADPATGTWQPLSRIVRNVPVGGTPEFDDHRDVARDQWIGISDPYQFLVVPENSGWKAVVAGESVVRYFDDGTAGMQILRGRVALSATAEFDAKALPTFLLQTGTVVSPISLSTADTRVGIEVRIRSDLSAVGAPAAGESMLFPSNATLVIHIFVAEGAAEVRLPGDQPPVVLSRSASLQFIASDGLRVSNAVTQGTGELTPLPAWIYATDHAPVPELQDVMRLVADAVHDSGDVASAAAELTSNRNPTVGVVATNVLTMTRNVDRLLSVLMGAEVESVRRAAIDGLSSAAADSPIALQNLMTILETRFPADEVGIMLQLIEGITISEAKNPDYVGAVFKLLDHERTAVRELAIYRMEQVVQDRFGFHADSEPTRRHESIRRWQRHLDRNAGQLLP